MNTKQIDALYSNVTSHINAAHGAGNVIVTVDFLREIQTALNAVRNDASLKEIERWRNVTDRKDPDDCAVGIKELYDNWQTALEQRNSAIDALEGITGKHWQFPVTKKT